MFDYQWGHLLILQHDMSHLSESLSEVAGLIGKVSCAPHLDSEKKTDYKLRENW